jgi:hypothetical protein
MSAFGDMLLRLLVPWKKGLTFVRKFHSFVDSHVLSLIGDIPFPKAPSMRSMASLGILAAGCAAYVATDKQFLVEVPTSLFRRTDNAHGP